MSPPKEWATKEIRTRLGCCRTTPLICNPREKVRGFVRYGRRMFDVTEESLERMMIAEMKRTTKLECLTRVASTCVRRGVAIAPGLSFDVLLCLSDGDGAQAANPCGCGCGFLNASPRLFQAVDHFLSVDLYLAVSLNNLLQALAWDVQSGGPESALCTHLLCKPSPCYVNTMQRVEPAVGCTGCE